MSRASIIVKKNTMIIIVMIIYYQITWEPIPKMLWSLGPLSWSTRGHSFEDLAHSQAGFHRTYDDDDDDDEDLVKPLVIMIDDNDIYNGRPG